jgi:hypothetical protein
MDSPGHRTNLLNPVYEHIGIGYAFNAGAEWDHYWTQVFGETPGAGVPPLGFCPVCSDATDNDGDGLLDGFDDPGCFNEYSVLENPRCDDDLDNDGDGGIDWDGGSGAGPTDAQCVGRPYRNRETPGSCGLGFEIAPLLAGMRALRRRGRRGA